MDIVGVGYKAEVQGNEDRVRARLFASDRVSLCRMASKQKPNVYNTKTSINQYQTTITLSGIDKQMLGQVAAELNRLRKPDAYKGKGVRYADKFYRLKPGKTGK